MTLGYAYGFTDFEVGEAYASSEERLDEAESEVYSWPLSYFNKSQRPEDDEDGELTDWQVQSEMNFLASIFNPTGDETQ